MQAGIGAIIGEDFLETELGFAVGVDWRFRVVLRDWDSMMFAVGSCSGGEDELFDAVASYRVEKVDPAGDVGGIESARFTDGFGHQGFCSKVHDRFDFVLCKYGFNLGTDRQVGVTEDSLRGNSGAMPFLKIVEHNHLMAARKEDFRTDATDITGAAGDKDLQGADLRSRREAGRAR